MLTRTFRVLCLFLLTSLLSSCASTRVVDTWRNPGLAASRLHKLLVVRVTPRDGGRGLFEDVLAAELQRVGVEAVPGHQLLPDDRKQEWPLLEGALAKSQADGVLTIQTVSVEQRTTVQPGYPSVYPGYWYPSAFSAWDLRGYYGAAMYYDPTVISTYNVSSIQTNLFDPRSGKLIWAATVETSDPDRTLSASKDLARVVVRALLKEGLL